MPRSYCLSAIMLLSIYFILTTTNRVHCDTPASRVITICITANFHSHPTKHNCVEAYPITSILLWKMFNARFVSFEKRILLSDRCEPSMLTEVSRNTHRNIPHATFAVVHDRIVISNAPDSCPLKSPLAPCILPGPVETGGQQGQLYPTKFW